MKNLKIRFAITAWVIFILCSASSAQVILDLRDKITGAEVVDAVIEINSEAGGNFYYASDLTGKVIFATTDFPISIFIQHLSYERLVRIIQADGKYEIELEPKNHRLNGVVVTGQYYAQSSTNSVYRVKSIEQTEIKQMAATDLSEVMVFAQNVKVERDQNLNGSYVNFLGLGGNNVKVLLDGMPVAGRTALEFDLSQINLANVEKIEIVEGPMSVEYGSNALAGVVNIITKKHLKNESGFQLKWQEESIGSQYGFEKGKHDISVGGNRTFFEKVGASASFEYKHFGGSEFEGEQTRAFVWDPKKQIFGDIKLNTEVDNGSLTYRVTYYRDWIDNLGREEGPLKDRATDDKYKARRWNQHLSYGKYYEGLGRIDAKISYSDYKRIKNTFIANLVEHSSTLSSVEGAQDTSIFKNVSFWTHFTSQHGKKLKIKAGVDIQYDYTDGGRIITDKGQSAVDAALFGSAEYMLSDKITLRPGIRWAYNSRYTAQLVPSLNLLFALSASSSIRVGYARGFRAPALRELFFEFIDNTHRIIGNPDLTPERSNFLDVSHVYTHRYVTGLKQKVTSRFFYTRVEDQITFAQDANDPTITTLLNNDVYKAFGFSLNQQLFFDQVEFSAGVGVIGTFNQLSNTYADAKYLYTPEITAGFKANILNTPLQLTTQFKYNGKEPSYILVDDPSGGSVSINQLVKSDDYYMMDIIGKYKFNDKVSFTLGVKNLFDIGDIRIVDANNFHKGGGEVPISYGRSLFLRINYSL